jgi:hypothetical protein
MDIVELDIDDVLDFAARPAPAKAGVPVSSVPPRRAAPNTAAPRNNFDVMMPPLARSNATRSLNLD